MPHIHLTDTKNPKDLIKKKKFFKKIFGIWNKVRDKLQLSISQRLFELYYIVISAHECTEQANVYLMCRQTVVVQCVFESLNPL